MHSSTVPFAASSRDLVSDFIADKAFPCVGAKSALHRDRMRFTQAGRLGDAASVEPVVRALRAFAAEFPSPGTAPVSLIATFEPLEVNELEFERLLWKQLRGMHEYDVSMGSTWDSSVSSDPRRSEFSFSIGGCAYFVVGLHPGASRFARRTPVPCLVFNFHEQFAELKASGKYETLQTAIRARDIALQGSVNPVLSRFGDASEARQYSGRAVEKEWRCPFDAKGTQDV